MSRASVPATQENSLGRAPAQGPALRAGRGAGPAPTWRLVGALARLEGRKLVRHPVFLAGVGLALVGSAVFVAQGLREPAVSWEEDGWTVFVGIVMLGLLTMVAANYATLRDRRERTGEQQDSLPVGEPARTGALLVAIMWPAAVSAAVVAVVAGYAATIHVRFEDHEVLRVAESVLAVAMLGTLGIALARWLPNPFLAPLAAWGLLFATPSESVSRWRILSPFTQVDSLDLVAWHIAYVVGLTTVFCAGALLRRNVRPLFVGTGMVGLAVVSTSVVFLLPQACPSATRCLF